MADIAQEQQVTQFSQALGLALTSGIGQTFTPTVSFSLTKITIKVNKSFAISQNIPVHVQGTTGGFPDGTDIGTATINTDDLPLAPTLLDYEITIPEQPALTAGTKYCFYLSSVGFGANVSIRCSNLGGGAYAGGNTILASPGWSARTDDLYFITYSSAYSGTVTGYWKKIGSQFAPAWLDPILGTEVVGIVGKTGATFYPICDDDIGGHTTPTIPLNGIIIKQAGKFAPQITLP